jgi:hypothetical protein
MVATDAEFLLALADLPETATLGNWISAKRMRLREISTRLRPAGEMSPWDDDRAAGESNGWGPGPLEDYVKLSGQSEEPVDPLEAVDIFIRRNVPRNHQPHLLDNDDNDGEYLRRIISEALERATARR